MLAVILPDTYCARDVTIIARDNNDGTADLEAFDAGGGLWPVSWNGLATSRLSFHLALAVEGRTLFATPERRF